MRVLKFGGSSVATPDAIRKVTAIIRSALEAGPITVVVSAFGGVTNGLLASANAAAGRDPAWQSGWEELRSRHRSAVAELGVGARGRLARRRRRQALVPAVPAVG